MRPETDVLSRRRAERRQVAANEQVARIGDADVLRADPALGRLEEICATPLPRPRRRHPDEIDPRPDHAPATPRDLDELVVPARPVGEQFTQRLRSPFQVTFSRGGPPGSQEPCTLRRPDRDREGPVVAAGDDVDRLAHQRRLDDRASLERPREIVPPKALETGPEPDVRVRRVLVLDAAEPFQRSRDRQANPLEQQLPGEQRPVQLAPCERALRHGLTLARRPESCTPWAAAIPPTTSAPPRASQIVTGSSRKIAPNATASGGIPYA